MSLLLIKIMGYCEADHLNYNCRHGKGGGLPRQGHDAHSDQWVISPRMATREGVAIMHGKIIEDTEIEIDDSELEDGEKWTANNFKP